ncbi:MAG: hypothetical protein PHS81_01155, partial [Candidatus Nanoarchaeia archaeon]|nr:hypothetical protein [Candidatus Nanoarchaeia archaeon]
YYFYAFIAFIFLRLLLSGPFLAVHTIIVFSVPILYVVLNKHYHILKFDINDTIQSVITLFVFSFTVCFFLLFAGIYLGNFNWVNIFDFSWDFSLLMLLLSFNYELLIRYFFQGFFEKKFGSIIAIILSSFIGGAIFLPDYLSAGVFFGCGLFFGFIFSKTNDMYGVSIGGFLLRMALAALA